MSGRGGGGGGGGGRGRRFNGSTKVSMNEALEMTFGVDPRNTFLMLFVLTCLSYVTCSICLVGVNQSWSSSSFVGPPSSSPFHTSTLDCFWLSIALCIVLPLIAKRSLDPITNSSSHKQGSCSACWPCRGGTMDSHEYSLVRPSDASSWNSQSIIQTNSSSYNIAQPLLTAMHSNEKDVAIKMGGDSVHLEETVPESAMTDHKRLHDRRRELHLFFLFILSTAAQVYIGIKAISFNFKDERLEGALMGLGILFVNIMVYLLRNLVAMSKEEDGILLLAVHKHKLKLIIANGHRCDECTLGCVDGESFRCNLCDYDLCRRCYEKASKGDTAAMEGQIRSDKGIKTTASSPAAGVGRDRDSPGAVGMSSSYLSKCINLIKTERLLLGCGISFLLIGNLASLLTPTVQGSILDAVVTNNTTQFSHWIFIYIITAIIMGLVGGMRSLSFNIIGRKIATTLKLRLFSGILVQDIVFFDGNHSGDLTSRLTSDIWFLVQPINSMFGTIVSNSILMVGGVVLCFITSWRLSMLAFTTIGPIIYVTQAYASWSYTINAEIYAAVGKANSIASEALSNIRTVKACATEEHEERRFAEACQDALSKGILDAIAGSGMTTINTYLDLFSTVLILWYGGILAMAEKDGMTAGKLITFQLYFNMLNSAYNALLDIFTSLTRSAGAASRVFDLIDNLPDIDLYSGIPIPLSGPGSLKGDISMRNVNFSYQMRPDKQVLKNINLDIPAGTVCALVGQSGGGKSTIVNLLLRFYDPSSGTVLVDGQEIRSLRLKDIRKHMGVVQQATDLFAGTILENITYGCEEEKTIDKSSLIPEASTISLEMVIEAAKKACAHDFITLFPDGYLTHIGERGIRISGGQKQRISIARAFLRKPKLLLLDEATSALDAESEASVQEALDRLIAERGATILLVAHRLSTVINAHQILVVTHGEIVERGSHHELLAARGAYFNLVQRQLKSKAEILSEE